MSASNIDLYQMIMAYGYWKNNNHTTAVFHLYFRENPFGGSYSVFSGLELILQELDNFYFSDDALDYFYQIKGYDGKLIFSKEFIDYLRTFKLNVDIDSVKEGTIVFPHEPVMRIQGPILQCQFIEAILINLFQFNTLVSTKAARIYSVVQQKPLLEFGLRRAPGLEGGLLASRAAFIGGFSATSNLEAGKKFNIPVKGTLSHSWILSHKDDKSAFEAYYKDIPNNCIFLVDTYNTIDGIKAAIEVAQSMKNPQKEFIGIRIDSGDLAYLSKKARLMLDQAGFNKAKIVASSSLDEYIIQSLKLQKAQIDIYAVGTKLVSPESKSEMQTVYKLSALITPDKTEYKIKISDDIRKTNIPGILQVRRYKMAGKFIGDAIFSIDQPISETEIHIVSPNNPTQLRKIVDFDQYEDLLIPVMKKGTVIYHSPALEQIRHHALQSLSSLDEGIKRLENPHMYPAGIENALNIIRMKMRER